VSASDNVRDKIRQKVKETTEDGVELLDLAFQPLEGKVSWVAQAIDLA